MTAFKSTCPANRTLPLARLADKQTGAAQPHYGPHQIESATTWPTLAGSDTTATKVILFCSGCGEAHTAENALKASGDPA